MQLTIAKKISVGFLLLVGLLLITNVFSYFGLKQIKNSAISVVDEKMPILQQTVSIKNQLLILSTITTNGYYKETLDGLSENIEEFESARKALEALLKSLSNSYSSADFQAALDNSEQYLTQAGMMYATLLNKLLTSQQISEQVDNAVLYAQEASALMIDLSYLELSGSNRDLIIGTGNNIDNKLLTLSEGLPEFLEVNDHTIAQTIISDLNYSISNIDVDVEYLKRITEGVNTGDTLAEFNKQLALLKSVLNAEEGLISLGKYKIDLMNGARDSKEEANSAFASAINAFDKVFLDANKQTVSGQTQIIDTVTLNLLKTTIISIIGIILAFVLANFLTRSVTSPLVKINKNLIQLGHGDLTKILDESGGDEFSDLSMKVNSLTQNLRGLVGNILTQEEKLIRLTQHGVELGEKSLSQVNIQKEQISDVAENTSVIRLTSQSNLEQINQAMTFLESVTSQNGEIVDLMNKNRVQSEEQAAQVNTSADIIHHLDEKCKNISQILDVIKNIAEQTNLLALNAAIEAARAGEQGRGFAVVADEVRTLATRTHNSTEEIEQLISGLQNDASAAVNAINRGKEQSKISVNLIKEVSEQAKQTKNVTEELKEINLSIVEDTNKQDKLLGQVVDTLHSVVELASQSAHDTNQANSMTENIADEMKVLKKALEQFTL